MEFGAIYWKGFVIYIFRLPMLICIKVNLFYFRYGNNFNDDILCQTSFLKGLYYLLCKLLLLLFRFLCFFLLKHGHFKLISTAVCFLHLVAFPIYYLILFRLELSF